MAQHLILRHLWLALGWMLVLLVIYLSLTPAPVELRLEQGDKLSHVLSYFVLMSWFANLHDTRNPRSGFALGFLLLEIVLEFAQRWTGFRSFEVSDMAAGIFGVLIAYILAPPRTPNYLVFAERILRAHS